MFGSQTQWRENKVDEKITSNRNVHTQIFIMSLNSVGRNAVDTLTRGTKDELRSSSQCWSWNFFEERNWQFEHQNFNVGIFL